MTRSGFQFTQSNLSAIISDATFTEKKVQRFTEDTPFKVLEVAFIQNRKRVLNIEGEFLRMIARTKIENCRKNPKELSDLLRLLNQDDELGDLNLSTQRSLK